MFCPDCGTSGVVEDRSKKGRKTILPKSIFDYLNKEFDDLYAVGYHRNIYLLQRLCFVFSELIVHPMSVKVAEEHYMPYTAA